MLDDSYMFRTAAVAPVRKLPSLAQVFLAALTSTLITCAVITIAGSSRRDYIYAVMIGVTFFTLLIGSKVIIYLYAVATSRPVLPHFRYDKLPSLKRLVGSTTATLFACMAANVTVGLACSGQHSVTPAIPSVILGSLDTMVFFFIGASLTIIRIPRRH